MKPKGQLWTFEYQSGDRAQLDYLILERNGRTVLKTRVLTHLLVLLGLITELSPQKLNLAFAHRRKLSPTL